MAPNADQNRLRNRFRGVKGIETLTADHIATDDGVADHDKRLLKSLKGTEISIEGVVYDIADFDHPGGESVKFFGGNDVTIQYRMIHPYHTDKHLTKMRKVGKVTDHKSEYKFDTEFERDMKREVFKIVRRGKEFGTPGYFFRAFFYVGFHLSLQYVFATSTALSWKVAVLFGIAQAFIGLNVQHDANHGAASKKPWVNDLMGFGADLIGGCKWSWMAQHWTHHAYTNHGDKDPDSFSSEPVFSFNDYPHGHPKRRWWHQFQGFYFLPVLSFYWLSLVFNPQVIDLKHAGADYVGIKMDNDFIVNRRKYAISLRLMYLFLNFYCPFSNNGLNLSTLGLILLMGASESIMLAMLFSLSHNFEGSDRDPTEHYDRTGEPVCWFRAQVESSSTYGGVVSGWLTGGLNCQVEHHLFPRMSSSWYPYIAPAVRDVCAKHGVRYVYYPWIHQNLRSTFSYMHKAGIGANWEWEPLSGK